VLLHVVDILPADGSDPASNYLTIESELRKFNDELFQKPRIVAINKIDLIEENNRDKVIKQFLKKVKYKGNSFNISALNGMGCKPLVFGLYELIEQEDNEE
jgi:GTP-binding protein